MSRMLYRMDYFTTHCLRTSFMGASRSLSLSPAWSASGRGLSVLSAGVGGPFRTVACRPLFAMPPVVGQ